MLLFKLSEEKRLYSFDKKQEQMQYIGTLSQLNSKAGTNITKKFINTNKFYDKQEPEEHKIAVLRDINNPNRQKIESNKKQIEIAKHEFESGECLGHECTINERIDKLTALYNSYITYFQNAYLYGSIDKNKYQLIETLLKTNPLNNETIDKNTKGFREIRRLSKNIELLIEAQRIYSHNIDIGYLLNKSDTDYKTNRTDTKRDYYITVLKEYYKLLEKLYARLEEKENLNLITIKDTTKVDKHRKECQLLIEKITRLMKNKNASKTINSLFELLNLEFISINSASEQEDELIKQYKRIENNAKFILKNFEEINRIEARNNKINSEYETEKEKFIESLNDSRIDKNLLEEQYKQSVEPIMKEKTKLIEELKILLN